MISLGALVALTFSGAAIAAQSPWKRQYVPNSAFSVLLPGKLTAENDTVVEDKNDWVEKSTDHVYQSVKDGYSIQITTFFGKKNVVANAAHLEKMAKDIVVGISEKEDSVREMGKKSIKIDEKPVLIQSHSMGKDSDRVIFKSLLLGDGNKVYVVMAVGFPEETNSMPSIDKVMNSVRYKTGLTD